MKVLELFGGIGAPRKALTRLGIDFETVDYVEIDKYAVKSYNAMYDENYEPQDVTKWDKDIDVDMIFHGSPCQDFSIAGKGKGGEKDSGTRSSLLWETLRIVEKLKPKYVIWENVKAVTNKKHKPIFDKYCDKLRELGYTNYAQVLNAKDYRIPQNRERVFVISILNPKDIVVLGNHHKSNYDASRIVDVNGIAPTVKENHGTITAISTKEFNFPPKQELKLRLKDMLEDEVDEKYYLSDELLKKITLKESDKEVARIGGVFDNDKPHQAGSIYAQEGLCPTLNTMEGGWRQPSIPIKNATKKGYIEVTDGDGIDLAYPESETRRGRVQKQKSNTITTGDNLGVLENYRIRKLTPLECWRLMGFDDSDFYKAEKVCSNTQLYKQAGNSIVVNVLEAIFKELLL